MLEVLGITCKLVHLTSFMAETYQNFRIKNESGLIRSPIIKITINHVVYLQ
jgi:hypothetical protein